MPRRTLQTDAFVLLRQPAKDAFQGFTVFSAEHGSLLILQRVPKISAAGPARSRQAAGHLALDLFDEVALLLESSNQGRTWFVQEPRLLTRHPAIGRSYDSLRFASALAAVIARNPVHEDSRATVADLLRTALAAFAAADRPDIVYFKSLYCFARDEGYPVKQEWVSSLPPADRARVAPLLSQPLAAQTAPAAEVARLQGRLEDYLRGHTDILMD